MRILILGQDGQLGKCLYDQISLSGHEVVFTSKSELDVCDLKKTKELIADVSPFIVVNATAFTDVDRAEVDVELAYMVNHTAIDNIAETCANNGSVLIHVSTDYVFDGRLRIPYHEDSKPNPLGEYGRSKLYGELAIIKTKCRHLIIRTSWLFSEYGNNFLTTMIKLGAERDHLDVIGDQIGCPTYAQDLALAIATVFSNIEQNQFEGGVYHYCGYKECSWYSFSQAIFMQVEGRGLPIPRTVKSIRSDQYPTVVERPRYSVLDCSRIEKEFGIPPSNWYVGIGTALDNLGFK